MHSVIVRVQLLLLGHGLGAAALPASANTSGIAPTGTAVTVKDNGDGTVTMATGIVSMVIEKAKNRLNSVQYTSSNSGARSLWSIQLGAVQTLLGVVSENGRNRTLGLCEHTERPEFARSSTYYAIHKQC